MNINFKKTAAGYAFEVPCCENGFFVELVKLVEFLGCEYEYDKSYCAASIKITKGEYNGVSLVGWWDGFNDFPNRRFVMVSDF